VAVPLKYLALWSMLRNERWPLDALERERDVALRRLVTRAYENVRFYRRLFDQAGVTPDDIRTAHDLRKLPVIDKHALRTQPIDDLLRAGDRVLRLTRLSTSGSSGAPFDVYIDARCSRLRKAQSLRPYLANGRRLADRCLLLTGHPDREPKWFERLGVLREQRLDCKLTLDEQLAAVNASRPQVIQGYPSALTSLAAFAQHEGRSLHRPRLVFTDSELLTGESRRLIEDMLGVPPVDVYGTWETGNIAYQCERRQGHHVAIDCVVLEVVTDDGNPAGPGEEGRLVCTVLDNDAMPLIRYDLGDVAAYATEPCACGRSFPLLEVITGRANDQLRLADGRTISPEGLLARFDAMGAYVREYQVIQDARERFHVVVVPGVRFDETAPGRIRAIFEAWRPSVEVTIEAVERIPREPSGKRRAFRSRC
jgi:phenylacetate-CoA ligase